MQTKLELPKQLADFDSTALPAEARTLFQALLCEERLSTAALRAQAAEYAADFRRRSADDEFVDAGAAEALCGHCQALLDGLPGDDDVAHRLVQAAVRYFVTEDDGDSDLGFGGLDDDLAVVRAVATHLNIALSGDVT